jgi:aryl-phospho-beta-D-glucosidase BglC (GH1 family)
MYNGVPEIFAIQLDSVWGKGTADEIRAESEKTVKYTIDDLKAIANTFKKAIRRLEKY